MSHGAVPLLGGLTPIQLDELFEVGFTVVRGVFDAADIARLSDAFDRLEALAEGLTGMTMHRGSQFVLGDRPDGQGSGGQIQRVVWCGAAEPTLLDAGADPRLLRIAVDALGAREMDQLINQAHFKRPGDGVAFPWHQDSRHRRYGTPVWRDINGRGSFIESVMAVDAMDADNGPLSFIPGSCQLGHLQTDPETDDLPVGAFDPASAVSVALDPGDIAIFGPYTIHGSGPNHSDRSRRTFLNGYAYPGANTRVYPGEGSGRRLAVDG